MLLVMRPTVPVIAPYVDSIWVYGDRPAPSFERVLPTGSSQLLVNLDDDVIATYGRGGRAVGGAALQAAHGGPVLISTAQQRRIVGVSFRPGGAYPFFLVPPGALDAPLVGLDDLWGREGAVLRERLLDAGGPRAVLRELESVLVDRLRGEHDPAVAYAVAAFERGAAVGEVADRLGLSRRRFGGTFTERVGLTPKRFARIRRFQRVLATITAPDGPDAAARDAATGARAERGAAGGARATRGAASGAPAERDGAGARAARSAAVAEVDWAAVAVEHGFCDQSHLIRDFHDFAGTSPTGYRPRSGEARNHVPVCPIAADDRGAIMAS